jgi:hypothetical protein
MQSRGEEIMKSDNKRNSINSINIKRSGAADKTENTAAGVHAKTSEKSRLITFLLFVSIIILSSCQTVEYKISGNAPKEANKTGLSQTYASLALGIIEVSGAKTPVCGEKGVSTVTTKMTAVDVVIHFLAGGIFTSRKVTATCID